MRTDEQIVQQTNEIARQIYLARGYEVPEGYRFDQATHPHEVQAWEGACAAQLILTETDPNDALDNIEADAEVEEEAGKPAKRTP